MERDISEIAVIAAMSFAYTLMCWVFIAIFDINN